MQADVIQKWSPLAAYMEKHPGKIEAISKSLAVGKLGAEVRFGFDGPTCAEIDTILNS